MPDELQLVVAFAGALATTLALTPLAIAIARGTNFYDLPAGYKGHETPTPYLGGLAVVLAFEATALVVADGAGRYAAIVAGALFLWLVGTVDDRWTLPPLHRLVATAGAAALISSADLGWALTGDQALDLALTIVWVVLVVNGFNLMDNMDGAAASVAAVSAAAVAVVSIVSGSAELAALALALAGACFGFLKFNLASPARIFLGDGGSMAVGFVTATVVMAATTDAHTGWSLLIPAVLLVGLPVFDTTLVIVSRYRRRVKIWAGGRDHITFRLKSRVGSVLRVALTLASGQALLGATAIVLLELGSSRVTVLTGIAFLTCGLSGLAVLESGRWQPPWNGSTNPKAQADFSATSTAATGSRPAPP